MKLTVEQGSFGYKKDQIIFENVNFEVSSGEILAILVPNGDGKTTMLRCITGMLNWRSGASKLDGQNIRSIPERKLWQRMAYVPQAKAASSAYTAFETVLLGRSSHLGAFSTPKQEDVDKAREAMETLGILHLVDKKCSAISGGELQMVLIARALASEPEILILDEPESNLDFKNQLIVLDTITKLAQKGMACIFNTHYPEHALQRSHKALLLSKGGEYRFGDTADVVTEANIQKAFGVRAIIGEVETPEKILRSVTPLAVTECHQEDDDTRRTIASVTIIAHDNHMAEQINGILHSVGHLMIGRMGMPYRECGLYIINITLDGTAGEIRNLVHRLGLLPGVSAKATFAQGDFQEGKTW